MSEAVNNASTSENYDAQQTVEEIQEGDRKAPTANVEADYEASKQFSTSPIDSTEAGAAAAEAATAPNFAIPKPDETASTLDSTGNPDAYKDMAKDVGSSVSGSTGATTDELYQKALEKGKPGA
ncbi:hypothetical protein H6F86_07280 [Phormidium sp. FACHB-592]|uniref:Uncharacterized protein n=1 Tax=Stenomitos frigidus AS-A4 TaxID=2933935 RepID=A0ABV0KGL6_9CYAN|nr:hypothetical protein [Phormidium sp. FACHB-592]MBD2073693.1 hypothetical protein [Phormidium sp. FACHB-592]